MLSPLAPPTRGSTQSSGWRWLIAGMLFLAAVLNYIDRQTLSILAPTIQRELELDDRQYADVASIFFVGYTLSLIVSGRLIDRLGTRLSMTLFVGFWSIANMATLWARSFATLGVFRGLLGFGEAGNWPTSAKVVAEWFPARQRGLAIGIYTSGATIGATVAPLLLLSLTTHYGWRSAFAITGAAGLLWIVPWLLLSRLRPHSALPENDSAPIIAEPPSTTNDASGESIWSAVFGCKAIWLLMIARMLTDPVWYFYQFWLAKYLHTARGLAQEELGITWVVFLAADIGSLAGGWASGWLIGRGAVAPAARMRVMFVCACAALSAPLVALLPSTGAALAVAMLAVLAHLAWLVNLTALLVDLIPARLVGTAFGFVAAGSAIGGILMNQVVGELVTRHSYTHWFVIMAFLHPLAWLMLFCCGVSRLREADQLATPLITSHG